MHVRSCHAHVHVHVHTHAMYVHMPRTCHHMPVCMCM